MPHTITTALAYIALDKECCAKSVRWDKRAFVRAVPARQEPCPVNHVKYLYFTGINSPGKPFKDVLKLEDTLHEDWIVQDLKKVEAYQKKSTHYKKKAYYRKVNYAKTKSVVEQAKLRAKAKGK